MIGKIIIGLIIRLLFSIASFHFIHKIYINTVIDPFKFPLTFEEKKYLFNDIKKNPIDYNYDCESYKELIMAPKTQKLGDIFILGINKLFKCSLFFINFLIYDIFSISFFILSLIIRKINIVYGRICKIFQPIIGIFNSAFIHLKFIYLINLVLLIYVLYLINTGDIDAYLSFLLCKNINYDKFEKYRNVENIKYDFRYFFILQIFSIIMQGLFEIIKNIIIDTKLKI